MTTANWTLSRPMNRDQSLRKHASVTSGENPRKRTACSRQSTPADDTQEPDDEQMMVPARVLMSTTGRLIQAFENRVSKHVHQNKAHQLAGRASFARCKMPAQRAYRLTWRAKSEVWAWS